MKFGQFMITEEAAINLHEFHILRSFLLDRKVLRHRCVLVQDSDDDEQ